MSMAKKSKLKPTPKQEVFKAIESCDWYLYLPRNWRTKGITETEIRKRLENPELNIGCMLVDDWKKVRPNEFPFCWSDIKFDWSTPKKLGIIDEVVKFILQNKERGLKEAIEEWKRSFDQNIRCAKDGIDWEDTQKWLEYAEKTAKEIALMSKWLGVECPVDFQKAEKEVRRKKLAEMRAKLTEQFLAFKRRVL